MAIEMPIALLLLHPLAGPYEAALMPGIALIRSTLLSLGCGRSTRHATLPTQSDFRVSDVGAGGTSTWAKRSAGCRRQKGRRGCGDGPDLQERSAEGRARTGRWEGAAGSVRKGGWEGG
jgi:hypothetical protein